MVTVPGTFSSVSTGPGGFGSSGIKIQKFSLCLQHMEIEGIIWTVKRYSITPNSTCDSNFNAEWVLADNVLDSDGIDSSIWALRGSNQKLGCSLCVADGHLFRHWHSIFQPGDLRPRGGLWKTQYNFVRVVRRWHEITVPCHGDESSSLLLKLPQS